MDKILTGKRYTLSSEQYKMVKSELLEHDKKQKTVFAKLLVHKQR